MTDEQIKQNAEEYASKIYGYPYVEDVSCKQHYIDGYIAGAHSRDEEIKELNGQVTLHKDRADYYHDLYMKLRNPWISVEDRLPEKTKGIFSCQVLELEKDKIVYYKDTRGYIHTGFLNVQNHWRDLDRDNAAIYPVTHWMPISELKRGE